MFSFALIRSRLAERRGWLLPLALALGMFAALLALGGDRGYFYRKGEFHDFDTIKTIAIAEHLAPEHDFRLAYSVWRDEDGEFRYKLYSRFPIGGYALTKVAIAPFGDDLAAKLIAARVLMLLMFCGAAALSYLAIARMSGSRWIALVAAALAFSSFYAIYYADSVFSESAMDMFGAALAFHGMVVFAQEGRFRQLLVKVCVALLLGWRVYALLMPFIALGLGGEALGLLRAALASSEKAKAARSAFMALVRSRYAVLAAVSFLFGAALLGFNLAAEFTAYGGERAPLELPTVRSMTERFGVEDAAGDRLEWGSFLRLQFYRAGMASVPYAAARAVGYDVPTTDPAHPPLAWALWGVAATCAALGLLAFARRYAALWATAVLFAFCWAIPMRHTTFAPYHTFEGIPYIWLALGLFALALAAARRRMPNARLAAGFAIAAAIAAAPIFAASVFLAGQLERDADDAALDKAELADFSAIMETVRDESVQVVSAPKLWMTEGEEWHWDFEMRYYLSGSYFAPPSDCAGAGGADFAVVRHKYETLDTLTPENGVMFLYETPAPLELCRAERRRLESLEPAARAAFDVYLQDGAISYLKAPCEPSDYAAPFFAYAYPARLDDLPAERRREGFHPTREAAALTKFGAALDGACLMTLRLPDYPIAAIRTGQRLPGGESAWDIFVIPPMDAKALSVYDEEYRAIASGAPAARSDFDLYLEDGALSYLKEPCDASDVSGRFFISVYPADAEDLPAAHRERGHESLNFDFSPPFGATFGGKCLATRPLPDYDIAKIETGQWIPGGERLWAVELALGDELR